MKDKKRLKIVIVILCLTAFFVCSGLLAWKVYQHEKKQSQDIADLKGKIGILNSRIEERESIVWTEEEYNYLAIGNSITRHGAGSYWWNDRNGMAASDADHDYYHIVLNHLEGVYGKVHGEVAGLSTWESQSHDRDEVLVLLDRFLNEKINLVTIQLGENAENLDTYERDYESLIHYIQGRCPKAKVIVIGDFWSAGNRDHLKAEAAKNAGAEYVSLEGIKDNKDYYAGMGTTVYDDEGNPHTIDHAGVANHPGDQGMAVIAERIISVIDNKN